MKAYFCLTLRPFAPLGYLVSDAPVVFEVLHTFSAPENVDRLCIMSDMETIFKIGSNPNHHPLPRSHRQPNPPPHLCPHHMEARPPPTDASGVPKFPNSPALGQPAGNKQPACTVTPATVTNPPANQSGNFNDSFPRLPLPSPTSKISTEVVGHVDTVVYRLHLT